MTGGAGDDLYYVNNAGDSVIENASQGWDTVYTTISYSLAANVDAMILMGTANINATGNVDLNGLVGNAGNNILDGGAGNDVLTAGNGADTLIGGLGADIYDLTETVAATDTVRVAAGDSLASIGGYDQAVNFRLGIDTTTTNIDQLDLASTLVAASVASINGIDSGSIHSHSINSGIISFGGADNFTTPLTITAADLNNVFSYLQGEIVGTETVAFISEGNTFVFQDGGTNPDTVVALLGVTASSINTLTGFHANSLWLV
jgi:hypothetical protein